MPKSSHQIDVELLQQKYPVLGQIEVVVNSRSCRFTFRANNGGIRVSCPVGATTSELERAIDRLLPKLIKMLQRYENKCEERTFSLSFSISTTYFRMHFRTGDVECVSARFANGNLEVVCPVGQSFEDPAFHDWIIKISEEAMRHQSKRVLIPRLLSLASKHGFSVNRVSIHKSHGRWGSCSSRGSINLSLYLILLPPHLQDYVILHELCHTKFMDHSPHFWALLDTYTQGQARALRDEMKDYDTSIFYQR